MARNELPTREITGSRYQAEIVVTRIDTWDDKSSAYENQKRGAVSIPNDLATLTIRSDTLAGLQAKITAHTELIEDIAGRTA